MVLNRRPLMAGGASDSGWLPDLEMLPGEGASPPASGDRDMATLRNAAYDFRKIYAKGPVIAGTASHAVRGLASWPRWYQPPRVHTALERGYPAGIGSVSTDCLRISRTGRDERPARPLSAGAFGSWLSAGFEADGI